MICADMKDTRPQQAHAEYINDQESKLYVDKYMRGAKEHGGKLWEMSIVDLLNNAIDELLDLKSYLFTLKTRIEDLEAENQELRDKLK